MKLTTRVALLVALTIASVCIPSQTTLADEFYVSVTGDDNNPGTQELPWRTVSTSSFRISPGDRLLIEPGDYLDEGRIFVRTFGPNFEFLPIESTADAPTIIQSTSSRYKPCIYGSFDVRGSNIIIEGLQIVGDQESTDAGVEVFESHNICVQNCLVEKHGGGGIQFNHSDVVRALFNVVRHNATTNPDQHSGISTFQPIVRTDQFCKYGVVIYGNVSYGNRNEVPNSSGSISDGNGIIIDDHAYTQTNGLTLSAANGEGEEGLSSGSPRIDIDESGQPLPYQRASLVSRNFCFGNGGRGIHVFLSDKVLITGNTCLFNNQSSGIIDTLPRDVDGTPFFVNGELSIADSTRVFTVKNTAFAFNTEAAAASEHFFDLQGQQSTNRWKWNWLINFNPAGPRVSVANSDSSDLLD